MPDEPVNEDEILSEIAAWVEEYAAENGWVLNPDTRQLNTVLRGLTRNTIRFGFRYCPCRLRSGDPGKDREIICPCVYHRDEIEAEGNCHCNLFFSKNDTRD